MRKAHRTYQYVPLQLEPKAPTGRWAGGPPVLVVPPWHSQRQQADVQQKGQWQRPYTPCSCGSGWAWGDKAADFCRGCKKRYAWGKPVRQPVEPVAKPTGDEPKPTEEAKQATGWDAFLVIAKQFGPEVAEALASCTPPPPPVPTPGEAEVERKRQAAAAGKRWTQARHAKEQLEQRREKAAKARQRLEEQLAETKKYEEELELQLEQATKEAQEAFAEAGRFQGVAGPGDAEAAKPKHSASARPSSDFEDDPEITGLADGLRAAQEALSVALAAKREAAAKRRKLDGQVTPLTPDEAEKALEDKRQQAQAEVEAAKATAAAASAAMEVDGAGGGQPQQQV